jgi:hypothetical protein
MGLGTLLTGLAGAGAVTVNVLSAGEGNAIRIGVDEVTVKVLCEGEATLELEKVVGGGGN